MKLKFFPGVICLLAAAFFFCLAMTHMAGYLVFAALFIFDGIRSLVWSARERKQALHYDNGEVTMRPL